MARDSFDFDSVQLPDGGFYHSAGDAQGTMMVGWGRSRRNKWVQLSQAEITSFVANAHEMIRTDNPAVKGALEKLAEALAADKTYTVADLIAGAEAGDPALSQAVIRYSQLLLEGRGAAEALKVINGEIRDAA